MRSDDGGFATGDCLSHFIPRLMELRTLLKERISLAVKLGVSIEIRNAACIPLRWRWRACIGVRHGNAGNDPNLIDSERCRGTPNKEDNQSLYRNNGEWWIA